MFVWHMGPAKPDRQLHVYALTLSTQDPPLRQGDEAHSLTLISHSDPAYPRRHEQEKPLMRLLQTAPFWHGEDRHSFTFVWQKRPVNPGLQVQTIKSRLVGFSEQVPKF
jgi:hypothetical protein